MKSRLISYRNSVTIEVQYDPASCDWNEAIAAGLAEWGFKEGQVVVIAIPMKEALIGMDQTSDDIYKKPWIEVSS